MPSLNGRKQKLKRLIICFDIFVFAKNVHNNEKFVQNLFYNLIFMAYVEAVANAVSMACINPA